MREANQTNMILRDGATEIDFAVVEVGETDQDRGDIRLRVRVSSIGFRGDYEHVWIRAEEFERFIKQLDAVERNRAGTATLSSMSPNDLELRIRIRDSAGHVSVEGYLGRFSYGVAGVPVEARIGYSIDLDPGLLAGVREEFRDLAAG
jgi:hypothetical protein